MLVVAIVLAACAVYAGSLGHEFTYDDEYIIVQNPAVTGAGGIARILTSHYWAGEDVEGSLYRPLTILSYRVQFLLTGLSPWSWHLVNILLHGVVTALVFLVLTRVSGSVPTAAAASILFAVHPIHAEAVVSVVGRAELLAALFLLAAWWWRASLAVALPLFLCAMLSKESAIVLPALLVLGDRLGACADGAERPTLLQSLRLVWPFFALALVFAALHFALTSSFDGAAVGPFAAVSAGRRVATALDVTRRYLGLLFWPATLSADYSFDQIPILAAVHPLALAGAAVVAACLAAALAVRSRAPAVACGTAMFFVALLPAGNFLFPTGVVMAERLLYLPSAFFCLVVAAAIEWLVRHWRVTRGRTLIACCATAAILGTPLAARSVVRTADWADPLTRFATTVKTSPRSAMAWFGLGHALQKRGDVDAALDAYRRSLAIAPFRSGTHFNLGRLHEKAGRIDAAIASYEEAIRLDPSYQQALNNLGILHQDAGRLEQAETYYRRAIESGVERSEPAYNLATVLEARGNAAEAMQWYRAATRIEPGHVMAFNNLGRLLLVAGQTDDAIAALESALAARPDARLPRVNLAAAWYAKGDIARAEALVVGVLQDYPDDQNALRMLQAIRGR